MGGFGRWRRSRPLWGGALVLVVYHGSRCDLIVRDGPFSVRFGTAPCSGWTLLVGDMWAVRDAIIGRVLEDAGSVDPGRCGFSVQFHLSASTYRQYAQVFVYDPEDQLLGLNESNARDSRVLVKGDGGPYTFSRTALHLEHR